MSFKIEDLFSVKGKVVVVTGGGSGLGKAIASGFVENGAKVYIVGRRKDTLDKASQEITARAGGLGEIVTLQGDVATKAGCVAIAEGIQSKEDRVDVLINCSGVSKPWRVDGHPDDPDHLGAANGREDFDYTNSININGVYFLTAALLPLLRKAEDASVVVIASIAGLALQRATGSLTYGVSKAAAIHLGKMLAGRLSPLKIRVNTVCPGIFPSEMTGNTQGYEANGMNHMSQKAGLRSMLGRAGRPEEIVGPILMLSTKGGGYVHGAVLTVDGGRVMVAGTHDGIKQPEETYTYAEVFPAPSVLNGTTGDSV